MYILRPHAAGNLYAPPFIHPPPLGGSFQGWGGWACIKFGPVFFFPQILTTMQASLRVRCRDVVDPGRGGTHHSIFPPRSAHGGHGLKETKQVPPQVLLTGLNMVLKRKAQNPKSTFQQKYPFARLEP